MRLPPADPIEVYPVMGRLAIALRETVVFRFWSLLLDLARKQDRRVNCVTVSPDDLTICGIESKRTLIRYLERALSLGYIRRAIPLGNGYYRVYFSGQCRVNLRLRQRAESAEVMNSDEWDRRKVFIASADFASIARFEGAVFAGWVSVAKHHERRATWAVLQMMWGVTRQAMETWIKRIGTVKRFENWANVDDASIVHLTTDSLADRSHIQRGKYRRATRTFFQRGNTWYSSPHFAARGLARQMFADVQIDQPTKYAGEGATKRTQSRHSDDLIRATRQMLTAHASEAQTNFKEWRIFNRERGYRPSETLYYATERYVRRSGKAVQIWHCAPAVVA